MRQKYHFECKTQTSYTKIRNFAAKSLSRYRVNALTTSIIQYY